MRRITALAALGLLAGCAYPLPSHVAALNALVGKSETDLIRAYGVPTRSYETGGHKFLAYSMSKIESTPGSGAFAFGYGYGWGGWPYYGGFGGFPPEIIQRDCDTTFELGGGVVLSWKLRGNDC